jgi:predicted ATPase
VRGLSLLEALPRSPERDRTELRLQAILGTSFMQARGWAAEEVARAYTAAANLSQAAETTAEAIWILWGLWVYYQVRGRIDDALEASARIQALADRERNVDAELVADMIALQVLLYAGRFAESCARCESFARRYDAERHRPLTDLYSTDLELVSVVHHSIALWIIGEVASAEAVARRAAALADTLNHPYSVAWCSIWGSLVDVLVGRIDQADARCQRGMRIAHEQQYAYVAALGEMMAGWIDGLRGDPDRGVDRISAGLAAFCATGSEIVVPFFRTVQAELRLESGRPSEALELLEEAMQRIEQWGERWQEAEVHRVRANALAALAGDTRDPAIEASYRRAIAVAEQQGAHGWRMRADADFARYLGRTSTVGT